MDKNKLRMLIDAHEEECEMLEDELRETELALQKLYKQLDKMNKEE